MRYYNIDSRSLWNEEYSLPNFLTLILKNRPFAIPFFPLKKCVVAFLLDFSSKRDCLAKQNDGLQFMRPHSMNG